MLFLLTRKFFWQKIMLTRKFRKSFSKFGKSYSASLGKDDIEYYLCGSPMMAKTVLDLLHSLGVDDADIRFDNFGDKSSGSTPILSHSGKIKSAYVYAHPFCRRKDNEIFRRLRY
jgi:hypothetical protein